MLIEPLPEPEKFSSCCHPLSNDWIIHILEWERRAGDWIDVLFDLKERKERNWELQQNVKNEEEAEKGLFDFSLWWKLHLDPRAVMRLQINP